MDDFIKNLIDSLKKLFTKTPDKSTPSMPTQQTSQSTKIDDQSLPKLSGKFQAPIKGPFYNSGNFSPNAPTDYRHKVHNGVDIRAAGGESVYPMCPGVVSNVGSDKKGGNILNIKHEGGLRTDYFHLGTINVRPGDKVDYDTVIGTNGASGNAANTMPHIHFQVLKNGVYQNPGNYFPIPPYTDFDKSKEKVWLSDAHKQQAQNFNVQEHLKNKPQQNNIATASKIDTLVKIADIYYNLTK